MTSEQNSTSSRPSDRKFALGAMTFGAVNIFKVVLQLLLLPVMARLMGPNEFGLYALALPTISLVALLADGGLGVTLAREEESSSLIWSSAFWALLLMGIVLALGSTVLGVFIGYLAHQPRLPSMIALLSLSLVFLTLSVVPVARLSRRKKLGIGAAADLVANLIGAILAVAMAWNDAGAWSLVAQYLATYVVRTILLNMAAFHLPAAEFSFSALRPHLVSGGILIASRICEYAGRATENVLVERIFGTVQLGSYNFANQVSKFATDAAGNVVWGTLYVQALTEGKDKVILLHRQLCRLLGLVLFPATCLAAAAAPELTNWILGPRWPDFAFLFRVFLPLYTLSAICAQTAPLLLAFGRFDIQFWCMFAFSLGRVLAIALGFCIGFEVAIYGVAFITVLYCLAMLILPGKVTGCRPLPVLLGLFRPAVSSLTATYAFFTANNAFPLNIKWTFVSLAVGCLVYVASMLVIDRKDLSEDWNSTRRILSRSHLSGGSA